MIDLAFVFFKIGFVALGGGWAIVGVLKAELVSRGLLTPEQFAQAVSIAQITPGPVAINLATYTGYMYYGFTGALLNTLAFITPPILVALIAWMISRKVRLDKRKITNTLRSLTTIMITVTVVSLFLPYAKIAQVWIIAGTIFLLSAKTRIHPIFLIITGGFLGVLILS